MSLLFRFLVLLAAAAALAMWWQHRAIQPAAWSGADIAVLRSLWIDSLKPLPPDPSNAVAEVPLAAEFGRQLFMDPRLSQNGAISCATCHRPDRLFTDGLARGQGLGTSKRNTPSIIGTAYSPWLYWDGRRDSQWSQALSPIEDPNEQGTNRVHVVRLVADDHSYRSQYEALFGPLPDMSDTARFPEIVGGVNGSDWDTAWTSMASDDRVAIDTAFSNIGKCIAAFERTLVPKASPFDDYVAAVSSGDLHAAEKIFTTEAVKGLRLFIGEGRCTQCHNGPLFTNNEFHNTAVLSAKGELPDKGRVVGVREVLEDPFNCRGAYSDDPDRACPELEFVNTGTGLLGAFRTPSLRNVAGTAPYMHKGQIATLKEALLHYDSAPEAMIGHNEARPLGFSARQLNQLQAFLETLSSPMDRDQSDSM